MRAGNRQHNWSQTAARCRTCNTVGNGDIISLGCTGRRALSYSMLARTITPCLCISYQSVLPVLSQGSTLRSLLVLPAACPQSCTLSASHESGDKTQQHLSCCPLQDGMPAGVHLGSRDVCRHSVSKCNIAGQHPSCVHTSRNGQVRLGSLYLGVFSHLVQCTQDVFELVDIDFFVVG